MARHREYERLVSMAARQGADAVVRKELGFVEHDLEHAPQTLRPDHSEQPAFATTRRAHARDLRRQVLAIVDKPFEPPLESRETFEQFRLERLDGEEWD